jgi:HPt (histidine-containing phosphotransfer) domain-containing protein
MEKAKEQGSEVLDEALALSCVGGDTEFLAELIGLVQAAWPSLLADIRGGMAMGDLPAVERTARLAKAAAHCVSARRTYESALQLETMITMGDLPAAQRASARLEQEVERLQSALPTFARSLCSA